MSNQIFFKGNMWSFYWLPIVRYFYCIMHSGLSGILNSKIVLIN